VFTGADSVAVCILNVYNLERPDITQRASKLDFHPSSGGADFPLYSMEDSELTDFPDWAATSYEVANLQALSKVKFPITIVEADPTMSITEFPVPLGDRVECQVEFTIGIDILLFGEWKELKPYRKVTPREPDKTIWEILAEIFGVAVGTIILTVFLLIGIIGSGVAFYFLRGRAIIVIGMLWAGILFILWFMGVLGT